MFLSVQYQFLYSGSLSTSALHKNFFTTLSNSVVFISCENSHAIVISATHLAMTSWSALSRMRPCQLHRRQFCRCFHSLALAVSLISILPNNGILKGESMQLKILKLSLIRNYYLPHSQLLYTS